MTRDYELKRRAEQMEETRRRIVEAAIDLHGSVGPARTTVSAIAERAGVQRQTFYRHFPDERSLLTACSGLHTERNPMPDPGEWREIADPAQRLRRGLGELYAYFGSTEDMVANILRDAEVNELVREISQGIWGPAFAEIAAALADGLEGDHAAAAVELVTDFQTWRLLVRRRGLSHEDAVDFAARLVTCAA